MKVEGTEKDYEEDYIATEGYRNQYSEVIRKTENLMAGKNLPEMMIPGKRKFNLTKIEVKKMNGVVKNLDFDSRSKFETIYLNNSVEGCKGRRKLNISS